MTTNSTLYKNDDDEVDVDGLNDDDDSDDDAGSVNLDVGDDANDNADDGNADDAKAFIRRQQRRCSTKALRKKLPYDTRCATRAI